MISYICETDISLNETIIRLVTDDEGFYDGVLFAMKGKLHHSVIENLTLDKIKNDSPDEGYYLLKTNDKYSLIEKYKVTNVGYIYTSTYSDVRTLFTWRLIPLVLSMATDTLIGRPTNDTLSNKTLSIPDSKPKEESQLFQPKLFQYDMSNSKYLVVGKRATGKTSLAFDFIDKHNTSDNFLANSLIISKSEKFNHAYRKRYHSVKIMDCIDFNVIKKHILNGKGCIVFDDMLGISSRNLLDELDEILLATQSVPCSNIPIFITLQLPIKTKFVFNTVFLLDDVCKLTLKRLYLMHGGMFPTFKSFEDHFMENTKDFNCLVIKKGTSMENIVFKYRAII